MVDIQVVLLILLSLSLSLHVEYLFLVIGHSVCQWIAMKTDIKVSVTQPNNGFINITNCTQRYLEK